MEVQMRKNGSFQLTLPAMASDHQLQVLLYLSKVESATKGEIYANVNFGYYHNWQKHFGITTMRSGNAL